jgi:3-methyladenine DNA glycosylase AlkC
MCLFKEVTSQKCEILLKLNALCSFSTIKKVARSARATFKTKPNFMKKLIFQS